MDNIQYMDNIHTGYIAIFYNYILFMSSAKLGFCANTWKIESQLFIV